MTPEETLTGSVKRVESSESSRVAEVVGVAVADEGEDLLRSAGTELWSGRRWTSGTTPAAAMWLADGRAVAPADGREVLTLVAGAGFDEGIGVFCARGGFAGPILGDWVFWLNPQ